MLRVFASVGRGSSQIAGLHHSQASGRTCRRSHSLLNSRDLGKTYIGSICSESIGFGLALATKANLIGFFAMRIAQQRQPFILEDIQNSKYQKYLNGSSACSSNAAGVAEMAKHTAKLIVLGADDFAGFKALDSLPQGIELVGLGTADEMLGGIDVCLNFGAGCRALFILPATCLFCSHAIPSS